MTIMRMKTTQPSLMSSTGLGLSNLHVIQDQMFLICLKKKASRPSYVFTKKFQLWYASTSSIIINTDNIAFQTWLLWHVFPCCVPLGFNQAHDQFTLFLKLKWKDEALPVGSQGASRYFNSQAFAIQDILALCVNTFVYSRFAPSDLAIVPRTISS